MLFGEICTILEQQARWTRIRLESDGQEGWVDAKMISTLSKEEEAKLKKANNEAIVAFPMTYAVSENNGQTIPLTAGTRLYNYKEGRFEVLGVGFRIDPNMVTTKPREMNQDNLLQTVRFFLNTPYLWGGKNALGMDCSGFTQVIMALFGKKLFRNASKQAKQGRAVSSIEKIKAGDLVFFAHEGEERITHVGIAIDKERVIHCSGRVKVEKLDEHGIFSGEQGNYTHQLIVIKRL